MPDHPTQNSTPRRRVRNLAIATAVAATAAGSAVAVAATLDDAKKAEQTILSDAAKRLGVQAGDLRDALAAAEATQLDKQLDAAVKAGRLTQEQADAIKAREKDDGLVLRTGPGGGPGRHGGPGFRVGAGGPGRGIEMDAAAKALGLSREQLFEQLRSGKTLAEVAKSKGKSLDDVKSAVRTAVKERLDADVKAGRITSAQRTQMLEHLEEHIDRLGEKRFRHHGP